MPDITDNACKGVDILKTIILMNEDLNRLKGMLVNITNLYQSFQLEEVGSVEYGLIFVSRRFLVDLN